MKSSLRTLTLVAATAAATALVSLPALALLSSSSAAPATTATSVVDPGPVLQPSLTDHLADIGRQRPVRVLVQADGSLSAALRAVQVAGLRRELSLGEVGIVAAVGTKRQVRALEAAGASRVDWADEQLDPMVTSDHRATREHAVALLIAGKRAGRSGGKGGAECEHTAPVDRAVGGSTHRGSSLSSRPVTRPAFVSFHDTSASRRRRRSFTKPSPCFRGVVIEARQSVRRTR